MVTKLTLLCAATLLLCGCVRGALYTDTIVPYSTRFTGTPLGTKRCEIRMHQIKEPVSGYNFYAEWTTTYILNEAKKAGINEIYYMDKRIFSILLGTYKRESLIVYGD